VHARRLNGARLTRVQLCFASRHQEEHHGLRVAFVSDYKYSDTRFMKNVPIFFNDLQKNYKFEICFSKYHALLARNIIKLLKLKR